jgi:pimeloyl-ACP methyl ester carboxylesterase
VPTDSPHGYTPQHYGNFRKWLSRVYPAGRPAAVPATCRVPPEALRVTRSGQVFFDGALRDRCTVADLNQQRIELPLAFTPAIKDRAAADAHRAKLNSALRQMLRLPVDSRSPVSAEIVAQEWFAGLSIEKLLIKPEPGILLPALFIKSAGNSGQTPAVVHFSERGKENVLRRRWDQIKSLADAGIAVLLLDVRGVGETDPGGDRTFMGNAQCLNNFSWSVGVPLIGMRIRDVLAAATYCRSRPDVRADRVALLGDNLAEPNADSIRQLRVASEPGLEEINLADSMGPTIALLAAALDSAIAAVAAVGPLASFADLASRNYFYHTTGSLVPHILRTCDLPDIAAALAPRPLLLAGAVNGLNQSLGARVRDVFAPTRRAYELQGCSEGMQTADRDGQSLLAFLCARLK